MVFRFQGIGALLVRKSAEKCLTSKRYFGGGTANGYLATSNYFNPRKSLHERFVRMTMHQLLPATPQNFKIEPSLRVVRADWKMAAFLSSTLWL